MAEIILAPTAQSKVIPLSLRLNDTDTSLVSQLVTNRQFNTADTDAWFGFTLEGLAATTGTFDLTLINLQDKSVFNHTDKMFNTNPFYYKLDSGTDELTNEIRHAGKWVGQLVVTLANGDSATRKFIFGIEGHILDGTVVQTTFLEDYNALISDIESAKDELTQYNIDYSTLISTVESQEASRVQAEITRTQTFNALVDSEIIAQNVATELQNVEATYAPRLLSTEQHLAEKPNLIGWELQNKTRKIRPLVTFISDDGNKKDYENLRPISIAKGVPFVSAVVSNAIGNTTQMTTAQLLELQGIGWEISSHTHTHAYLNQLDYEGVEYEIKTSKETLENLGLKCTTMCVPYGFYNDNMMEIARKYLRGARVSGGGINTTPLETYELRSLLYAEDSTIDADTGFARNSLEQYKYIIDNTLATNGWAVFLMHSNSVDATQLSYLSSLIDYIQSLNIDVVTLDGGLDIFGNIVDIGNYKRDDDTKKHFVVGADGKISTTRNNNKIQITKTDEYLNANKPSDFVKGFVYRTKVSTPNSIGFPESRAGTLITDRVLEGGWAYQEYHVYGSLNVYKRYATSNTAWSAWSQTNVTTISTPYRYQSAGTYTDASIPTAFPVGAITSTTIPQASAANFPEAKGGRLITDRMSTETQWQYQEYHVMGSINVYKRYATSDTTWSAWSQTNSTITTGVLQYRGTDTYLNASMPTDFPIGCITAVTITTTNATGFPENKAGRLLTDRLINDTTWEYQTYHPILSNAIYKRYAASATTWGAWTKVSVV